jgi:hypothetical protein
VESVVAGLEDPIDPAFARSVVGRTSSNELAPELLDELVGELLKVPARVWKEMFAGLVAYDDLAELGRITVPTLLVWGDADGLVGRDMQEMLAERIGGAKLRSTPASGIPRAGMARRASPPTSPPSSNDRALLDPERSGRANTPRPLGDWPTGTRYTLLDRASRRSGRLRPTRTTATRSPFAPSSRHNDVGETASATLGTGRSGMARPIGATRQIR